MNTAGNGSALYRNAIYFYLHFFYNGFFMLAIAGIIARIVENNSCEENNQQPQSKDSNASGNISPIQETSGGPKPTGASKNSKEFNSPKLIYWLLFLGVFLSLPLSFLWNGANLYFEIAGFIGVLFTVIAFFLVFKSIFYNKIFKKQPLLLHLSYLIAFLFFVKLLAQLLTSFSFFSVNLFLNNNLIIAYLHLVFLGILSLSIFLFLKYMGLFVISKKYLVLYLVGFISTELILFYKGVSVYLNFPFTPVINYLLVAFSMLLAVSICFICITAFKKSD